MTKNPLINALCATLYIALVAVFMFYGTKNFGPVETVIIPIVMISLFTLSAAVMGYLFLSKPFELYFDSHRKEAVSLFLKTVLSFALITLLMALILFSIRSLA